MATAPCSRLPGNVVFVKNSKVGGSTLAGTLRRMCLNYCMVACKAEDEGGGRVHTHGLHANQDPVVDPNGRPFARTYPNAFTVTVVRRPADRALSHYYHLFVSRSGGEAGLSPEGIVQAKLHWLRKSLDFQYKRIGGPVFGNVTATLEQYDLVMVYHRYAESLVALQLLLGLDTNDILHVRAKVGDGHGADFSGYALARHKKLQEEDLAVQAYVRGQYRTDNALEYALVAEAERRLDAQIARLEPRLTTALELFIHCESQAERLCGPAVSRWYASRPAVRPGTPAREAQAMMQSWVAAHTEAQGMCIIDDSGCGYQCLNANLTDKCARVSANGCAVRSVPTVGRAALAGQSSDGSDP